MSVFRGPHDLRAGDRVLVTESVVSNMAAAGEVRMVAGFCDAGNPRLVGCDKFTFNKHRFLRIAEVGEIIPHDTRLRLMHHALAGRDSYDFPWKSNERTENPYVVVSAPESVPCTSEIVELRAVLAQAERDAAKDFSLLRERIARLEESDE